MTLHHTAPHLLTPDTARSGPQAGEANTYLRLRFGGVLGLWITIVMPIGALTLTAAMTWAMWSDRRYAPMAVFAVLSLLFVAAPVRWRWSGYAEDRGSLGQRNGLIGGFSWIDLADVVAVSDGRQPLPPVRYLVLWTRTPQTDRRAHGIARFVARRPIDTRHPWAPGGELHPFRIDWSLLGRCNSRRLVQRLRQRGLAIGDDLLPRSLRRRPRPNSSASVAPPVQSPGHDAPAREGVNRLVGHP